MIDILFNLDFSRWMVILLYSFPALINFGISIYVYFFLPRRATNNLFILMVLLIGMWQFGEGMTHLSVSLETARKWYLVAEAFFIYVPPLTFMFLLRFTGWDKKIPKLFVFTFYLVPPTLFLLFEIIGVELFSYIPSETFGWNVNPLSTTASLIFNIWISLSTLFVLGLMCFIYFKEKTNEAIQKQVSLLIIGLVIPIISGLINEIALPLIFKMDVIPTTIPLMTIFSITVIFAIRKQTLLDYSPHYQWDKIVETMHEGLLIVDNEDRIMYANKRFCEMVGYSSEELQGEIAYKLLLDDIQLQQKILNINTERQNKKSGDYELKLRKKSGEYLWLHISGTPYMNEKGEVIGSIGLKIDITERKKAEEALIRSETRLRAIFNNTNTGFLLMDAEYMIVAFNERYFDLTKNVLVKEIQLNTNFVQFLPSERQHIFINYHKKVLQGETIHYEVPYYRKDGSEIWFEINSKPVMDDNNAIVGISYSLDDITERKKNELEKERILKELNNRNNELMQFNYIVSHNLRSPIANIIGLSNMLNHLDLKEEEKTRTINHLRDSAMKMDDLVKDLNTILSARSALTDKREKVIIPNIIKSIKNILEKQILETRCIIKTNISEDSKELFTVKSYFESILYNLVCNAIKYRSPERSSQIEIATKNVNNEIVITVTDNGRGIDMEKHKQYVFGLYKRFHLDLEGKGIGLYMTKLQIESLGGTISIESEVDKETTFIITLPLQPE